MAWQIELTATAEKSLAKLDRQTAKRILTYLRERVCDAEDPRSLGSALKGPLSGRWRYRVGDHRIICQIEDARLVVIVVTIGHRGDIYR